MPDELSELLKSIKAAKDLLPPKAEEAATGEAVGVHRGSGEARPAG